MKLTRSTGILALFTVGLLALPALGHPGHSGNGLIGGILHPLTGVDHLVSMLAIGLWAAQMGKRATWLLPAVFVLAMAAGSCAAFAGLQVGTTSVDQAIAASALVVGLLVAGAFRLPAWTGAALAGSFGIFHGYAHGAELQAGVSALAYGAGFICTTAALLAAGAGLGALLNTVRRPGLIRLAGAAVALAGVVLLGGVF